MSILVTGAADYIGSIVSEKLIDEGCSVVGLDNLCQGHRAALDSGVYAVSSIHLGAYRSYNNKFVLPIGLAYVYNLIIKIKQVGAV